MELRNALELISRYTATNRRRHSAVAKTASRRAGGWPARFLARLSESQARLGADRLSRLADEVARRRRIARAYSNWLIGKGRGAAVEPPDQEHAFLRYPVRVTDRQRFVAAAGQAGIDLGDWFVSPVHPVSDHLERWGYLASRSRRSAIAAFSSALTARLSAKSTERILTCRSFLPVPSSSPLVSAKVAP